MRLHLVLGALGGALIGQSIAGLAAGVGNIEYMVLGLGVVIFGLGLWAAVEHAKAHSK